MLEEESFKEILKKELEKIYIKEKKIAKKLLGVNLVIHYIDNENSADCASLGYSFKENIFFFIKFIDDAIHEGILNAINNFSKIMHDLAKKGGA